MTYYTVCPNCEYKLFKAGDGSNIEIYCPKCKAKLIVEIKYGTTSKIEVSDELHSIQNEITQQEKRNH